MNVDQTAQQLHQESIIIDGLNASYFFDPSVLQALKSGGITAVNGTIAAWHTPAETLTMFGNVYAIYNHFASSITPVRTVADIYAAKLNNTVGLILGFQDTSPIADDIHMLEVYHRLGVRSIQLTYNTPNLVGTGCMAADTGLTAFGRNVVAEMNRLGILVDISHCGPQTSLDAIEHSTAPVAITHANPSALCDVPRNKRDDIIKATAAKGGMIGAVAFPLMLTGRFDATIDDYIATIDYLVNLVGVDHVGLGPDFMEAMPREIAEQVLKDTPPEVREQFLHAPATRGFESIALCVNVTQGLLARGYGTPAVKQIMGENWLHLYQHVWQNA